MQEDGDTSSEKICKVYDEQDNFTAFVQGILAVLALASLYIKRLNEHPRRKFMVWWLDISKQGVGATYAHFLNMLIAALIVDNVRGDYVLKDQCAWYAMNFFIDTTLGLVISVIFLSALEKIAKRCGWTTLMNTGVYVGPDAVLHWLHQLFAWILILTLVKIVLILVLWGFSPWLAVLGDFLFRPLRYNIRIELLFVMIMFPGILNVFYFWVADGFLKASDDHDSVREHEADSKVPPTGHEPESVSEFFSYECAVMTNAQPSPKNIEYYYEMGDAQNWQAHSTFVNNSKDTTGVKDVI